MAEQLSHASNVRNRTRPRHEPRVSVRIRNRYDGDETVTCVIPGHERSGREIVAESLRVSDEPLEFSFRGKCGYESDFDYRSAASGQ
jgi:hypothetical protein